VNNNNNENGNLFRSSVKDVNKIETDTVTPYKANLKVVVHKKSQYNVRSPADLRKSTNNQSDAFFSFHVSKKTQKHLKSGALNYDATLDLHGCTIAESEHLLLQFINDCQHHQIKVCLIVHGQGHHSDHGSVLKPAVHHFLAQQENIDAFCPALTRDGGKGASYVLLKSE